ncbi:hypothetical protein [Cellulomonas composti]|uniref:hypothetical protein n=1 Tax=Cellulomonas composti TaxID=266130 RepID=UPI0011BE227C|nr:hypothetical protein [Cellulomonas composti]
MKGIAGPVALALVGLWVAYLVPHKLRHRQQLVESRVDDRFSDGLRVLAVSERRARSQVSAPECGTTSTTGLLTPGSGFPVRRTVTATGGTAVDRPTAQQDRITAEAARRSAQTRAAHAAALARRGAAARRRGALAGALLVLTVLGVVAAAALPAVTWVVAAVPAALLATVVVLGRRAVIAGRAADAAWTGRIAQAEREVVVARQPGPVITGRAVKPSQTPTQAIAQVVVEEQDSAAEDGTWSPVPVPRPTYALKPSAPRYEPAPLTDLEGSTAVRTSAGTSSSESDEGATTPAAVVAPPTTGSIDLDGILAKRRASGQ